METELKGTRSTKRRDRARENLPFGTVSLSMDGLTDIIKQAHSEYLLTLIMPTTTATCMFYLSIWYRNCAHNMHIGLFYAKGKQSTYAQQNFTHSNIQQRCANQRINLKKDAVKREELHTKLDSVINVNDGTQGFSGKSNRARLLSWLQKWDNAPSKRWKQFENCASKSTANDKNTKPIVFFGSFYHFFRSCYEDFVHCIYCAVVCFSTIIKITSILASLVLFFLLFLLWSRIFLWLHWIARVCTFYSTNIYIF